MANIIEVDGASYEKIVEREGIVLVDCWAGWCGPCKQFEPIFEGAAGRHGDHVFAKLNTQAHQGLVARLGIEHVPTLLIYRDGVELHRAPGSPSAEALDDMISIAERLDMDEVRADMDERLAG